MTVPAGPAPSVVSAWTETAVLEVLGFGLLALISTTAVAVIFRQHTTRRIPAGAGVLLGTSLVAVWLNVDAILTDSLVRETSLTHYASGVFLLGTFVVGAFAAEAGRRIGDRLACDVFDIAHLDARDEVVGLLRSARLVIELAMPDEIDDAEGYLPVDDETRARLAGRRFRFPRRLDGDELASRLASRVERDFDVDYVDVALADDGTIDRLALGREPSGLGASLPPGTVATAIQGATLPEAGTGDPVEVWTNDDEGTFVATGELRSVNGDVATVVLDEGDVDDVDHRSSYRLVTHPDASEDLTDLVPVLRDAAETMTSVTVEAGGPFEGEFAGWLPARVPVVKRDGAPVPFPAERETLQAGDVVYALGTPSAIRRLETYDPDQDRRRADDDGAPSEGDVPASPSTADDD